MKEKRLTGGAERKKKIFLQQLKRRQYCKGCKIVLAIMCEHSEIFKQTFQALRLFSFL